MVAPAIQMLRDQIQQLQGEIGRIQDTCPHPHFMLKKEHHSNTGNYDPSQDMYWTAFHCELCDKRWVVDGSV